MYSNGGCCIENYNNRAYDIMLKFRPIAPKPVSGSAAPTASGDFHVSKVGGGGRGRRKGSKGKENTNIKRCNKRNKSSSPDDHDNPHHHNDQKGAVTLSLLPEAPDLSPTKETITAPHVDEYYLESHCELLGQEQQQNQMMAKIMPPHQQHQEQMILIVEGITATWQGMMRNITSLETDRCPGFVTDAWNRITWANEAYYSRTVMGGTWRNMKMVAWVVMRESVPDGLQAFTCRVRVPGSCGGKDSRGVSSVSALTLPCDVWRIEGGGFAWRLDVDAALSLGR